MANNSVSLLAHIVMATISCNVQLPAARRVWHAVDSQFRPQLHPFALSCGTQLIHSSGPSCSLEIPHAQLVLAPLACAGVHVSSHARQSLIQTRGVVYGTRKLFALSGEGCTGWWGMATQHQLVQVAVCCLADQHHFVGRSTG